MAEEPSATPIDRALQRKMLLQMREQYPAPVRRFADLNTADWTSIVLNLLYLGEHGLCNPGLSQALGGQYNWGGSSITAKGIDFLADDGGLTAILGAITIKIEAETLRSIIAEKIEAASIPVGEKSTLRKALDGLSGTALKVATTDLVKTGIDHLPNAVTWLRTIAGL